MNFDRPKDNSENEFQQNRFPREGTPDNSSKQESKEPMTLAPSVEEVEQKLERPSREKELELAIRGAQDFRSLNDTLLQFGGLQGSQRFYPAEDLMRLIGRVSQGKESPTVLTNTGGLRGKVVDLLRVQQLRESLASDPREALKNRIADWDLSISDVRLRLQSASVAEQTILKEKLVEREKQRVELAQQLSAQN